MGVQPRMAVGICIEQQCDVGLSVSLSTILTLCTIRAAIEIAVLIWRDLTLEIMSRDIHLWLLYIYYIFEKLKHLHIDSIDESVQTTKVS